MSFFGPSREEILQEEVDNLTIKLKKEIEKSFNLELKIRDLNSTLILKDKTTQAYLDNTVVGVRRESFEEVEKIRGEYLTRMEVLLEKTLVKEGN